VAFLGHVINQHGISVDPKNVSSMVNWQRPATVIEIRSFLGLAGYYRRFVLVVTGRRSGKVGRD
jgi:hypothetical protein